jgi:arylformamidase
MSRWIDVSIPLSRHTVCWPGDRRFEAASECAIERGDECNVSAFSMSAHLGTHVDAPLHYIHGGASMDELPLDAMIGPTRVIGIKGDAITPEELERDGAVAGERLLFKTRNSDRAWYDEEFTDRYVHLTPDAARWLALRRPALIGVDYLSVGAPGKEGALTHTILLNAGIWIIESLDLRRVAPGGYELICLPLRIAEVEGAPARVILKILEC